MAKSLASLRNEPNKANGDQPAEDKILNLLSNAKVAQGISAVAGKYLTADRFLKLAINAVHKTPRLLECDPKSVLGAFMASAALGLEPNTVLQQAFLIPYQRSVKKDGQWVKVYDCQFQIGYRGFVTLAHRSPHILSLEAEAIHEHDLFEHMKGSQSFLKYQKKLKDRGELVGAFCFSKLEGGAEAATVLTLEDIEKIRGRSETYKSLQAAVQGASGNELVKAQKKLDETPWVLWADDMSAKSAIKKHAKQLPLTPGDGMAAAVALDAERDDGNTIDMKDLVDPDRMREVMTDGEVVDRSGNAALEHQPGDTVDFGTGTQREAEPIYVDTGAETNSAQQQGAPIDSGRKAADDLAEKMRKTSDPDVLDAHADLISELDRQYQGELNQIYRDRKAEINDAPPPVRNGRTQAAFSME